MNDLGFKESLALKRFINSANTKGIISNISYLLAKNTILNSEELLEKIILESLANDNMLDMYWRIREESKTEEQEKLWERVQDKIAFQYISANIYNAPRLFIVYGFYNISALFKKVIKEKIRKGKINQKSIDKISEMPFCQMESYFQTDSFLLITVCALKSEEKTDLFIYAIEKLQSILKREVKASNIRPEEKNLVLNSIEQIIKRYIRGGLSDTDLQDLCKFCLWDICYSNVISLARVGTIDMDYLTINQARNINIKNAKQIAKFAKEKYKSQEEYSCFDAGLFYKLYIVFGKQRTLELIDGKYGDVSLIELQNLAYNINIEDYNINRMNGEPSYDEYQSSLISFLFASGYRDVNANIKKIIAGEFSKYNFSITRLVNEWKLYYDFLGGNVTICDILKLMNDFEFFLYPNEKEISNTVKLAGVKYKSIISKVYKKMQTRTISQIPKVKGVFGEYSYEILDLVDPIQMNVGYYTNCCFTFGGSSENSLRHACMSEDSRIFVIKKYGKIVAQSWVWRNGNTVCFDNVETYGVDKKSDLRFWQIYEQASKDILEISKSNEPENKKIQLITIGKRNTDINLMGDRIKRDQILLPRDNSLYTDAKEQVILATSDDYVKPLKYNVDAVYKDKRKKIVVVAPSNSSTDKLEELNKHIDKINYSVDSKKFKESNAIKNYVLVIYGFDWYIAITKSGEIEKQEYSVDNRSKLEILSVLQQVKDKIKNGELTSSVHDILLDSTTKKKSSYVKQKINI